MNTTAFVILAIVIIGLAVGAFFYLRRRRSENLRKQFGPEYKHAVDQYGDQRKAEAELAEREKRVRKLEIRGLTADEQNRFSDNWKKTQARFVDAPSPAVSEADGLVKELPSITRMWWITIAPPAKSRNATKAAKQRPKIYVRRWCTIARYLKNYWNRHRRQPKKNELRQNA